MFLNDYYDYDVIDWLTYGFTISRDDACPDPVPAQCNHLGVTQYLQVIDQYVKDELKFNASIGPFSIPPFLHRIGISPLSTRPKRESGKRRIIMDLSFPPGQSVNDGISKFTYCGQPISLTYPTIDTLARRVAKLGVGCLMWNETYPGVLGKSLYVHETIV